LDLLKFLLPLLELVLELELQEVVGPFLFPSSEYKGGPSVRARNPALRHHPAGGFNGKNLPCKGKSPSLLAPTRQVVIIYASDICYTSAIVLHRRYPVHRRPASMPNRSVSADWRVPLDGDKSCAYLECIHSLETRYSMFSVTLDEAFELRRRGRHSKAYQVLSLTPALSERLAGPLQSLLQAMLKHAKHFGTTPSLAPLNAQNFQNPRSQRVALFNDLFNNVLLTGQSQFLHKIRALTDLVEELHSSFHSIVVNLISGNSAESGRDWELLNAVHYDLNSCLRESIVLLKSFFHALPDAQLSGFQASLEPLARPPERDCGAYLAGRRMAFLKGQ
jgi:hypothetical protein